MRIKSLSVKNNFLGWELEEIQFTANLTLLVGGSGVGKTQILRAINDLKSVANGKSINGFEWDISFIIDSGKEYRWEGNFEVNEENERRLNSNKGEVSEFTLLDEILTDIQSDKIIIKREGKSTFFQNEKINLKLDSTKSMLYILKEEKIIGELIEAFSKIKLTDNTKKEEGFSTIDLESFEGIKKKYIDFDTIKDSKETIRIKLLLCLELSLKEFNIISERFIDVFPQIESIKIQDDSFYHGVFDEFTIPVFYIKEKGVPKWIREEYISSGMLRTIIHIAELYLSNDDSVILIDEFENSLGVNCIDILTDDLIHERKDLQFIATSHHPYIINNIPYEYWKIVSRKGGKIQVRNAAAYKLGKSKQAAFLQLTKILEKQAAII